MAELLEVTQNARDTLSDLIDADKQHRTHVRVFVQGFG